MKKEVKKIRHPRPGPDIPPAKYEVGAKVLHGKYRVVILKVWWAGSDDPGWMYEVEGAPNSEHRGLWIHREDTLHEVI